MAESAVSLLLKQLAPLLIEEALLMGKVRQDVEDIRDELERMRAFLRIADAKEEIDPELQVWVKQVRDVAYDTEDVLDEFMVRLGHSHGGGFYGFLRRTCCTIKTLRARYRLTSKVQRIKSRFVNISMGHKRYSGKYGIMEHGSSSNDANDACYHPRSDALLLEEAELVGVEEPRKNLINWILKDDSHLKVVSVLGMGGLGKTTLVKKVYEDAQVKRHFTSHAWITVSQSSEIRELLQELIRQLFVKVRQPPEGFETLNEDKLKAAVKDFLQERRYVIVLDDIWTIKAWDSIKCALPNFNLGSRILLTTRNRDVASSSCVESHSHIYEMEALSPEGSWILFCRKTFQGQECPPELENLAKSILKKCQGLPLAIVAIAGLLASKDKNRLHDWGLVDRSLGAELEGSDELRSITKILLLSYNDLPYYLKPCLLYLSCFPEDHLISWSRAIQLWIAEGFVESVEGKTLEEVAESYLVKLLNRSLIQVAERRSYGRIKSCRMHDLLREIILTKARDQNLIVIAGRHANLPGRVRRMSIHNTLQGVPQDNRFLQLRSLLMFGVGDPLSASTFPILFNGSQKLLKVLELRDTCLETFSDKEMKKLCHLRYLSLRSTKLNMLPSSIGNLRNLLTLDLGDTCFTELPVEVLQLKQLRHLLLYRYVTEYTYESFEAVYGFVAPHGIGGLRSLQKLYFIVADQTNSNGITTVEELGNLTEMRSLGIVKLRRDYGPILCSSIQKMTNLRALTVVSTAEDEILDLDLSTAPQFLERLYLKGRLERLPSWVESCYGLARVQLLWSKLKDEYDPLQPLQGLPNLIDIKLYQAYEGEGLHFKVSGFRKLKILNLVELKGLRWIRIEEGSMSQLERILLENCDLLQELPIGIEHLKALECLELRKMSVELTAKLNPYLADGEYPKVAHIPEVWIGGVDWRLQGWSLEMDIV